MLERGSTSVQIVPVLVSCEEQSSCTGLILAGKRCEHKCSAAAAAAAAEHPTTCRMCQVTHEGSHLTQECPILLDYTVGPQPLSDCGQIASPCIFPFISLIKCPFCVFGDEEGDTYAKVKECWCKLRENATCFTITAPQRYLLTGDQM